MRSALKVFSRHAYFRAAAYFVWASAIVVVNNDNIFEVNTIDGASMSPTISPTFKETGRRDFVVWRKWHATRNVPRGDVIQFMNPLKPEALAVKRVIAVEGDVVLLDPNRRPNENSRGGAAVARAWDEWRGRVQVPQGHLWVEGDNVRESRDSNYYGPISKSLIEGRAVAVALPLHRFWTKPWVGFKSRTKVIEGQGMKDWTEGLPVELAEIRNPRAPP